MSEVPPVGTEPHRPRRRLRRRKLTDEEREHRRRRIRRHGRRAYIRSAYSLPSLATLGNAISGFGAAYVSSLEAGTRTNDALTHFFVNYHFLAAAYLIFLAMLFDALDGRLARFTRHTTDFGGQLDSLADVISFGFAPAFVTLQLFHERFPELPPVISRTVWAVSALYVGCAAIRLARFNVSNEHGEQHHFSFLGLPSPGAAAVVAGLILMQQDLQEGGEWIGHVGHGPFEEAATAVVIMLPFVVLVCGLLMVSAIRYPHLVNRYLRGRRSIGQLLAALMILLLLVVVHRYTLGVFCLLYALLGPISWMYARVRRRSRPSTQLSSSPSPSGRGLE
jgi:CDP-diacylglycerol--serine O-phosphatidyltransferase